MKVINNIGRSRRMVRVRSKISGTSKRPRMSIFRSNKHIYAQLIDDETGRTLASISDKNIKDMKSGNKTDKAKEVGKALALKAKDMKVKGVIFDKSGYAYHGRVKAIAEGAREEGILS